MKIGTMVNFSTPEDVKNGFEALRSFGIDCCQLCTWAPQYWTDENAQKVKELIAAYGMTVSAFWCGWDGPKTWNFYEGQKVLGLVPPEYRAMRVKNLCDGADFAHQLGLVNVITHMGFIPENPYDPEFEPLCGAIRTVAEHGGRGACSAVRRAPGADDALPRAAAVHGYGRHACEGAAGYS